MSFSAPRDGLGAIVHRYRGPKLSDDPDEQIRLLQETYHVSYTDVVDHVNQMLGRDPELHRPPRLSWDNLIKALAKAGIDVNEDELIRAPLVRDLSDEVSAEIRADISEGIASATTSRAISLPRHARMPLRAPPPAYVGDHPGGLLAEW